MGKGQIVLNTYSPLMVVDVSLTDAEGKAVETPRVYSLCRCGRSKAKPFCDGTHNTIGFSGERSSVEQMPSEHYQGREITIVFDRHLCMGAGFCSALEAVFGSPNPSEIDPDGAPADIIIETIRKCPSGALSYIQNGVHQQTYHDRQKLAVEQDGPLHVQGGVELIDDQDSDKLLTAGDHYTLCRCGASRKKPLCDGTHLKTGFSG